MNRSYSKIRHMQESNNKLEKRILSEQTKFTIDPEDMNLPNEDKLKKLFMSQGEPSQEVKKMGNEFKEAMNACVSENNLYKVKGFLDGIENKKMSFLNTLVANLFDSKMGGKSLGQEFNEFTKCLNNKIGNRMSQSDIFKNDSD